MDYISQKVAAYGQFVLVFFIYCKFLIIWFTPMPAGNASMTWHFNIQQIQFHDVFISCIKRSILTLTRTDRIGFIFCLYNIFL